MTQANFLHRFFSSITRWSHRTGPSVVLGTSLLLMSGLGGLGSMLQAQEPNPETTTTSCRVYHTRFQMGPGEGIREVTIEGEVCFSPDNTKIEWMSDGAYLRIITQEQGRKLRFDAKANGQNHPIVEYKVDSRANPFDENAASYLAQILPVVFRELGHDELGRVQTTYDQKGAAGVLQMISQIRSDYSIGIHVSAFLGLESLSDDEIVDAFSFLGNHINSDSELASVLFKRSDLYRERPGIRQAYLECLKKFQSDIEKARATQNLFGLKSISGNEQPVMTMISGC